MLFKVKVLDPPPPPLLCTLVTCVQVLHLQVHGSHVLAKQSRVKWSAWSTCGVHVSHVLAKQSGNLA